MGPSFSNASGWSTSPAVTVPAGKLYLWAEHTTTDSGQAYGFLIARAGDGVSAANLTLEDGTEVTATVQNGWAVAWWPGSHQAHQRAADNGFGHADADVPVEPVRPAQLQGRPARRRPGRRLAPDHTRSLGWPR